MVLAERRLEMNQRRADELRGGTFYKPEGGRAPDVPGVRRGDGEPVRVQSPAEARQPARWFAGESALMAQDPWAEFRLPAQQPPGGSQPLAFDVTAQRQPAEDEWAEFRISTPARERGALDVATQVPVGFNEALASVGGAPVDAATWLLNQIPGVNIQEPFGGSGSIKRGMGLIGANPDERPAMTPAENIARGAGAGVAMMAGPELALTGLARSGALSQNLIEIGQRMFGSSSSVPAAAKGFTVGAAGGAGGVAAEEAVPEPWKPLAGMAGGIAGGVAGALGAEVPSAVAAGARTARRYVDPLTQGGRERLAGETLASSATNPQAVRARLDEGVEEIIPGSRPTTFQATGDMGLGGLEREAATRDPAAFLTRRAEQNAARTSALESIQPNGSPADVSAFFRAQLRALDETTLADLETAQGRARAAAEGVGGSRSPEAAGEAILKSCGATAAGAGGNGAGSHGRDRRARPAAGIRHHHAGRAVGSQLRRQTTGRVALAGGRS